MLAVAGRHDAVTTVADLAAIVAGVRQGRLTVLEDTAHLPPIETPSAVAELIVGQEKGTPD